MQPKSKSAVGNWAEITIELVFGPYLTDNVKALASLALLCTSKAAAQPAKAMAAGLNMLAGANGLCMTLQHSLPCLCGTTQFTLEEMTELGSMPCLMFHRMLQSLLRLRAPCGTGAPCGHWQTPTYSLGEIQQLQDSDLFGFLKHTVSRMPWRAIRRQLEARDAAPQALQAAVQWTQSLQYVLGAAQYVRTADQAEAFSVVSAGHALTQKAHSLLQLANQSPYLLRQLPVLAWCISRMVFARLREQQLFAVLVPILGAETEAADVCDASMLRRWLVLLDTVCQARSVLRAVVWNNRAACKDMRSRVCAVSITEEVRCVATGREYTARGA